MIAAPVSGWNVYMCAAPVLTAFAGAAARTITVAAIAPLELIRTQAQAETKSSMGMLSRLRLNGSFSAALVLPSHCLVVHSETRWASLAVEWAVAYALS